MNNARTLAAKTLLAVVDKGRSLTAVTAEYRSQLSPEEGSFYQQLAYGSVRYYLAIDELLDQLLQKKIQRKERIIHMLIVVGIYQLWQLAMPEHAAIHQSVEATKALKKTWAKGLVNVILRRFQREREPLLAKLTNCQAYPAWLQAHFQEQYPNHWSQILADGNAQGPMTLRVNQRLISRENWLAKAAEQNINACASERTPSAVYLMQAVPVAKLPGFYQGEISVQDEAAQQAAWLLAPQNGERVLDACAAPGGKTGHLLELADLDLLALEVDAERLERVAGNLQRLSLSAELIAGDASEVSQWWDGRLFDRILLDAPCSGTGVIRRHPDIKLLRKPHDIPQLQQLQARLLDQLWTTLKVGGRLLYATCSIMQAENSEQMVAFLQRTPNAQRLEVPLLSEVPVPAGVQWFARPQGPDGFYFALLQKSS